MPANQADAILKHLRAALDRMRELNAAIESPDLAEAIIVLIQIADHALMLDQLLTSGGELPEVWRSTHAVIKDQL